MLWPEMGWRRSLRYLQYRLARHPASNSEMAASLAWGAVSMFIPIPGTHLASSLAVCWLLKLPLMPAVIGTLVGNPWTIPFAWLAAYRLGVWGTETLDIPHVAAIPANLTIHQIFDMAMHEPLVLLLPWTVAGLVLAIGTWPIFYWVFLVLIKEAKLAIELFRKSRKVLLHK
jgi:uncharacterized protein (DUF2062 family)